MIFQPRISRIMRKPSVFLSFSLLLFPACFLSAAVLDEAAFDVEEGWNAVYLPVTPEATADEIFADWPTDKVGFYDQAAFLRTKQFDTSAEDTTLGAVESGMKLWVRGKPGESTFSRLIANGIYIFNATGNVSSVKVRGIPAAMRISWHVCISTNQPLNFVGISTDGEEAELTEEGYFRGLDTGWTYGEEVIRDLWGSDDEPTLDFFRGGVPKKGNLGVVAMDAAKASDWSGALYVEPMVGVDFGTNLCQSVLRVRNEGGTNRQVRVSLRASANALPVPALLCRDMRVGGEWKAFSPSAPFECVLVRGTTLPLQIAIDRSQFEGVPAGTEYGAILDVTDVSTANPTHFRTAVPLSVRSDGGAWLKTEWPAGLWAVDLALDKVADKKAGSTMTARVLVHVDTNGVMNLMQRARVGSRRISSAVLPTDMSATSGTITTNNMHAVSDGTVAFGSGTFGTGAMFDWTVSDRSRVNPFRHPKHPDHDGLDWDFKDTLPSGDNFTNYVATVKPELFSISNRLELTWADQDGASWSPAEKLTGSCVWTLYGLRHEHNGIIKTSGTFTMKRVSKAGLEAIKEEL